MSQSVLDQAKFWEVISYLVKLDHKKSFDDICTELDIHKHQLKAFITFLQDVNLDLEDSEELLVQEETQHTLPSLSLIKKESNFGGDFQSFLQEAVLEEEVIKIKFQNKFISVFPHKLIHLEGRLCLIAESFMDQCLMAIDVNEVEQVFELNKEYTPHFSLFDIAEFIHKMRSIGEGEERLILKILDPARFKTENTNEFFMNPCLVMTPKGESIWAATVEKSPKLFDWLYQMIDFIEIIDPIPLKKEFLNYCQKKYKQEA